MNGSASRRFFFFHETTTRTPSSPLRAESFFETVLPSHRYLLVDYDVDSSCVNSFGVSTRRPSRSVRPPVPYMSLLRIKDSEALPPSSWLPKDKEDLLG